MQCSAQSGSRDGCRLSNFDYDLPSELIAQVPAVERDAARLLVVQRNGSDFTHAGVRDLPAFLQPGDLLVLNDTRVLAARVRGRGANGGAVELLLTRDLGGGNWECLGRPSRRLRPGATLVLDGEVEATVREPLRDGRYVIGFEPELVVAHWLERYGELPLPPYIKRAGGVLELDRERYQTVFASLAGAVAAPTAGLHFSNDLLKSLQAAGVLIAQITLHVGPGTFLPVRDDDVSAHSMEPEWATIPPRTADMIAATRRENRRVVAVGTTTVRTLESFAEANGEAPAKEGWADRFIVPGFQFRVVDALFTNFHLPRSTLLMLVSAFAGRERILAAYEAAVRRSYRFYSYGDAMLIV